MRDTLPAYAYTVLVALICLCLLLSVVSVGSAQEAPRIYFDQSAAEVAPDSTVVVRLFIESEAPVNALTFQLNYPPALIQPVKFSDAHSIITLWRKREWAGGNGVIRVEGGMLPAFSGSGERIAELTFQATGQEGTARLSVSGAQALYADGKGTGVTPLVSEMDITIRKEAPPVRPPDITDSAPPVFKTTQTVSAPNGNGYLAVFQAEDQESGIRDIQYRQMKWASWGTWVSVTNPVSIPHGVWRYQIAAADNAGNTRTVTLSIQDEMNRKLLMIIVCALVLVAGMYVIIKKWHFTRKAP